MIAVQIRGSLDAGPVRWGSLPASQPLLQLPLGPALPRVGGEPLHVWWPCSSLRLVFVLLLGSFCVFQARGGFYLQHCHGLSPLGDALGQGRRAVGGVSAAVLHCGAVQAEPPPIQSILPAHSTSETPPSPLGCACAGLMSPNLDKAPCAATQELCRGRVSCGSFWVSSVPAVADGSLAQKGKH